MKKGTLYTLALLLISTFLLDSCKKIISVKKLTDSTATDSAARHGIVSTFANGLYDYIAADNAGNIYALKFNIAADTIYKIDSLGNKSFFYTAAATTNHDTTATHSLSQLTIDSVGNLYTVSLSGNKPHDVLKITPSGSATTIYTNIAPDGSSQIENIAVNQGNFYFSNNLGIHKISPGGSSSVLLTPKSGVFTVNRDGTLYYLVIDGVTEQVNLAQLSASGVQHTTNIILDDVNSMTTDEAGNIYTGEFSADNNHAKIHVINAAETNKVTIISSALGHVDGPLATAKIAVPFSLVTNSSGSLYFSEVAGTPNDIRKITR